MPFLSCSYAAATYQPKLLDCNGDPLPAGTEVATCADLAAITIADATETVKGKVELATTAEAAAGTSTTTVVTPAGLKSALDAAAPNLKTCAGTDMAFDETVPTCAEMNAAIAAAATTVPDATDTVKGIAALNQGTNLPADAENCTDALTACGLTAILNDPTYPENTLKEAVIYAVAKPLGGFDYNNATASPAAFSTTPTVTSIHTGMKRCVLRDDGSVAYYLGAADSTLKADGTPANLTGADGQVMVEIPKFYVKRTTSGTVNRWEISDKPAAGYSLHPAFFRDGKEVGFRYYSAYDASMFDASASTVTGGKDYDNYLPYTDLVADKLVSVSGAYPMVGLTRSEMRKLAANRGDGWSIGDFWLWQAIGILFRVEFGTHFAQSVLGAGNSESNYNSANTGIQANSPHSVAGKSNSFGNGSTNSATGAASPAYDTAFMSYRGIENFYGNVWNWTDGMNTNNGALYVSNDTDAFADDTAAGYSLLTQMPQASGWQATAQPLDHAILPATLGEGSTTGFTDHYWYAPDWRVSLVGGSAAYGALCGVSCLPSTDVAALRNRSNGARLAY